MANPYASKPKRSFWQTGVADHLAHEIPDLYHPRFKISKDMRIACAGSCFAQHISAQFKARGYQFIDLEPPPPMLASERWPAFGFGLYSTRYGNIYTVRQLLQTFMRANGHFTPVETAWIDDRGRARDPFRPVIEPDGFRDMDEMARDQDYHLKQVARLLAQTDVFVFTLGLTEAWECSADGAILPVCPGTVGGRFNPEKYRFKNFTHAETLNDLERFIAFARGINPDMRFLFTVSPVPLTATATDQHVLVATLYSKSVLRAAVGELCHRYDYVDYFPSYELVAAHPMRAAAYMPNLRNVSLDGVARVMDIFFAAIGDPVNTAPAKRRVIDLMPKLRRAAYARMIHTLVSVRGFFGKINAPGNKARITDNLSASVDADDLICEEAILKKFGP